MTTEISFGASERPKAEPALVLSQTPATDARVQGEFLQRHIRNTRIKLMHKTSARVEDESAKIGDVFFGDVKIADTTQMAAFTVLGMRLVYEEWVEFGGEASPRIFDTEAEVFKAGGWTDWRENVRPSFSEKLSVVCLVKAPTGLSNTEDTFPYEFDGESFGIGMWEMKGSTFTRAGKTLITAIKSVGLDVPHAIEWSLTTQKTTFGKNTTPTPKIMRRGLHSPEFLAFAAHIR